MTTYEAVWNDGDEHSIQRIFELKAIVTQQLPNMPRDYIVRVMLDRHHRCLVAVEKDRVVGGICFRPFHTQGFAEIVFLAITEAEKHKGHGSLVMSQLKEHVKKENLMFFLTFADNTAIGYFVKQGFTKKRTMHRSRWDGYTKEYVRSTLMECKILHNVDYRDIKGMLEKQKEAVLSRIADFSQSHIVHKGLEFRKKSSIPIAKIPGVKEAGWKPEDESVKTKSVNALTAKFGQILKTIGKMKTAWPFKHPVNEDEAPDYYKIITHPMDLTTMENKLNSGAYTTKDSFYQDAVLIHDNCIKYNEPNTIYVRSAKAVFAKFKTLLKHI